MSITKMVEIELDEISDRDLFEELEDRIANKYILHTKEYQKSKEDEIQQKLDEVEKLYEWLRTFEMINPLRG